VSVVSRRGGAESMEAEKVLSRRFWTGAAKDVTALTDIEHELRLGIESGFLVYVGCWSHGAL
jgi:hypothetical protein